MIRELTENKKGFKVLKLKAGDVFRAFRSPCICDSCNAGAYTDEGFGGYYIAVLNSVYCQTCYDEFIERAVNHKEDQAIEAHNMEVTLKHLAEYEKP